MLWTAIDLGAHHTMSVSSNWSSEVQDKDITELELFCLRSQVSVVGVQLGADCVIGDTIQRHDTLTEEQVCDVYI